VEKGQWTFLTIQTEEGKDKKGGFKMTNISRSAKGPGRNPLVNVGLSNGLEKTILHRGIEVPTEEME